MELTISTLTLEAFLLVVVRTGCFFAVSPIFGSKAVNSRIRVLTAACVSLAIFSVLDVPLPEYTTVWGFSGLIIKEALVGLAMGFISSFVMSILVMAGEFIDREIGFTMSSNFDMNTGAMITITAELYDRIVSVIILITNMHFYILTAIVQSFQIVPVGQISPNLPILYTTVLEFIAQFFIIGFKIAMPVFISATILNIILGILAKSSPQMNMFVVGLQLKVFVGLLVLVVTIMFIPDIANYLMDTMRRMINVLLGGL